MAQPTDTSAISRLVSTAKRRIRLQWAMEGAATGSIVACAIALPTVYAFRREWITPSTTIWLLVAAALAIVAGSVISAARRLDDERIARKIDRASNLSDRLSTAIAFDRALREHKADPDVTHEMMAAAIRDGVKAAPRANVQLATPFYIPGDLSAALVFMILCALVAGIRLPSNHVSPHLLGVRPDHAPPGTLVELAGTDLTEGLSSGNGSVFLGTLEKSRPVDVVDWTPTTITVKLPKDAPIGDQKLIVFIGKDRVGAADIGVVDPKDDRFHKADAVALDPDEKAYVEAILAELKNVAQRDQVKELDDFAKKIEQLLDQAEKGEITKDQLLDELAKAEEALNKDAEPNQQEVDKQLADMGKELSKDQLTKDLGDALQKKDLEKAEKELEKLAEKLDKKELSDQQKQELQKKLDQVAKQMEKQDKQDQDKSQQQQQKVQDEIRRLEKQKDQAKNEQQKQEFERRLEEKKRELQKLQKDEQEKQQSDQRRAVKRLQKDMEKAAENLQKPQKSESQQEQDEREQQASQKLKDAARETGRVDKDQRKQATQKKMSSQMDDLREAMRRAKQKGNKGPQDPFNKQGKNQDFISRARGQKGQSGAWKPGQGQQQGKEGQGNQPGGQGQQPGGESWGTEHDPNLTGDPTAKTGNQKDQELQGKAGDKGGSTRETILSAAQKGFASQGYKKVYADYQRIVEEVMRTEKLPSSYKYYVKRYFAKIHPSMTEEPQQ